MTIRPILVLLTCGCLAGCHGDSDPGLILGPNPVIGYGTLHVTAETTGADLDDGGYNVVGSWGTQAIEAQGDVTIEHVPAGSQTVGLRDVALNCHVVGGAPRVLTVPIDGVANVPFRVTCLEKGSLRVQATTTGSNFPNFLIGVVGLDGAIAGILEIPLNGTSPLYRLPPGTLSVSVGASSNCTQARKQVVLPPGGDVTVDVAITCH